MNYPKIRLSNGQIEADVFLPDAENGYYRDSRFDWSGMIDQIRMGDHTFLCSSEVTHDKNFRASGTAEELCMGILGTPGPLGYDEAKIGGIFIKPGVGVLEKQSDEDYQFEKPYCILQPGAWKVERGTDWVEFIQTIDNVNGWGYCYKKRISLPADKLGVVIARTFENIGEKAIDTTHYCHNFMLLDDEPIGPDYEIRLPFAPAIGDEELFGRVATAENNIVFSEQIPGNDGFAWGSFTGFNPDDNYSFGVVNKKTGTGLHIEGDTPMMRFHLYCQQLMICPEPFVRVKAAPGETFAWQTKYLMLNLNS